MLDPVVSIWEDDFYYIVTALRICSGEYISGDQVLYLRHSNFLLIALVDGLGHGPEAAQIATEVVNFIKQQVALPLNDILQKAHKEFSRKRGASLSIVKVYLNGSVEHIGLGNIRSYLLHQNKKETFISRDGTLGWRMHASKISQHIMRVGDCLLMFSDGVTQKLLSEFKTVGQPWTKNKLRILIDQYGKKHDDGSILYLMKKYEKM